MVSTYDQYREKLRHMDIAELRRQRRIAPLTEKQAHAYVRGFVSDSAVQWALMIQAELDSRLDLALLQANGQKTIRVVVISTDGRPGECSHNHRTVDAAVRCAKCHARSSFMDPDGSTETRVVKNGKVVRRFKNKTKYGKDSMWASYEEVPIG